MTHDALAVVYDDGRMTEAARVWFILQYFGARTAILNGGWPAITSGTVPAVSSHTGSLNWARDESCPIVRDAMADE
ncbi:MAG: hypothetical protein Q8L71_06385 [Thiobacillus sp.]|nr:hypothetical protein [Thiobacillus sp.]